MNIRNMSKAQEIELDILPEEALEALREGREWEYQPDTVEGADARVYRCDGCDHDTWHMYWTCFGLRLDADGTLFEVEWSVDTDGDWEIEDEHPYGTYDHAKALTDGAESWRAYAQWVIENRRDPVGEFGRYADAERGEGAFVTGMIERAQAYLTRT